MVTTTAKPEWAVGIAIVPKKDRRGLFGVVHVGPVRDDNFNWDRRGFRPWLESWPGACGAEVTILGRMLWVSR
jgi:hypothetical protein